MSRTDLISDVFTIIRNASILKKETVNVPSSSVVMAIAQILKNEEYIEDFKLIEDKKQGTLRIYLKYNSGKPVINNLKRISKPSLRLYVNRHEIPSVLRGRGFALVSTSQGILTDKEAREKKVGGEVLGYVW